MINIGTINININGGIAIAFFTLFISYYLIIK